MEDSILLFWERGEKLILSMSCSAIISPYYIPFHPPPKTPQTHFAKKSQKKPFFYKIQQTAKSSSSSNSTHYLVLNSLTKVSTYSLSSVQSNPSPSTLNPHLFFKPLHTQIQHQPHLPIIRTIMIRHFIPNCISTNIWLLSRRRRGRRRRRSRGGRRSSRRSSRRCHL